jgi:hypothetical protein
MVVGGVKTRAEAFRVRRRRAQLPPRLIRDRQEVRGTALLRDWYEIAGGQGRRPSAGTAHPIRESGDSQG